MPILKKPNNDEIDFNVSIDELIFLGTTKIIKFYMDNPVFVLTEDLE